MSAVVEAKEKTAYETLALYIDGKFIPAEGRKTEPVLQPGDRRSARAAAARQPRGPRPRARRRAARVQDLEPHLAAGALRHPAQGGRARARARRGDRPQHHARPGQAARRSRRRGAGLRRARRMARRGMPPHLRPRHRRRAAPTCARWCCASRWACAPRSRRGISRSTRRYARWWRRSGAGCTLVLKGPGDRAQRGRGARPPLSRRGPAARAASTSCGACRARSPSTSSSRPSCARCPSPAPSPSASSSPRWPART